LVTLLLGLALATALWSAVQAINAEARASYDAATALLEPEDRPTLAAKDGRAIPIETYVALRRAGWSVSAVLDGRARLGAARVTVMGVDMLTTPALPPDLTEYGEEIAPVDLFSPPGIVFVGPETADRIGADLEGPTLRVSEAVPEGVALMDIAVAARILETPGALSRLFVLPDQVLDRVELVAIAPDLEEVAGPLHNDADTGRLTDSFHLNLTAFGLLSFGVGLFIVNGTIGLAYEQRRPMLRTLRALGVPLRRLAGLLAVELTVLAIVAGLLGIGLGYLVAAFLLPDVAATLRGLYGAEVSGSLQLRPGWVAAGLGMTLVGTAVASVQSFWRLANLPVLSATAPRGWARAAARTARWQMMAGLGLVALGALAIALFDGLLAGFAFLGGLLMGSALLLPPILNGVLRFAERRAKGPMAEWVWADMRAQVPGLSLALMALLLAMAANIGVGTMVSSFRLTFTGWLDQRLASDLYISTEGADETAEVRRFLAPRVAGIVPIRSAETEIAGRPARIYGVVDDAIYRENWPLLAAEAGAWDRIVSGRAVLINEQLHRQNGIAVGAEVALAPGWVLPVVGVYSDYGNPHGQAIVGLEALLAVFPGIPDRQLGVRLAEGVDRAALEADLRAEVDLLPEAVVDQSDIKAVSLEVFDKTFLVTGAFNVLTLAVAGFAMFTALLTLWTMRLPQVAPVWALGQTRRDLARLDLVRSLSLAGLTFSVSVPLGLALAWALLAVVNVEAFGWRLPMFLFPLDWLRLGLLALLAGGLAAAIPARRLMHVAPARLLRVFADDR